MLVPKYSRVLKEHHRKEKKVELKQVSLVTLPLRLGSSGKGIGMVFERSYVQISVGWNEFTNWYLSVKFKN